MAEIKSESSGRLHSGIGGRLPPEYARLRIGGARASAL